MPRQRMPRQRRSRERRSREKVPEPTGLLRLRKLSELRVEQSAWTLGCRNIPAQVPAVQSNKVADRGLDFLFARHAGPTCGKMRPGPPGIPLGKLAVYNEEQFLIGEMRLFRWHKFTV